MRRVLAAVLMIFGLSACTQPLPNMSMTVDETFAISSVNWRTEGVSTIAVALQEVDGRTAYCGVRTNSANLAQVVGAWAKDIQLYYGSTRITDGLSELPRRFAPDPTDPLGLEAECFSSIVAWEPRFSDSSGLRMRWAGTGLYR